MDKPKKAYARCPIGWQTGALEVLIGAISYEYEPPYAITSVEIYSQEPDFDLIGFRLQVKPYGSMRKTETVLNAPTNAFGFLRVVLPCSSACMNETGFDLMGFDVRLITPDRKSVDIAVMCYPMHIDRQVFRESGRIERIIPQYELDAGISSLLGSKWNDYYRSSWKAITVASAPTLLKPTTDVGGIEKAITPYGRVFWVRSLTLLPRPPKCVLKVDTLTAL